MVKKKLDIVSPNFPGEYPPDKTCVWRLCPRRGDRIKFHFNMFQLHPSDSISIDNGKRYDSHDSCGALSCLVSSVMQVVSATNIVAVLSLTIL